MLSRRTEHPLCCFADYTDWNGVITRANGELALSASSETSVLIKVESYFDLYATRHRFAARPQSRPHFPVTHLRQRLFFQAKSWAFNHDGINDASVGRYRHI